MKIRHTIALGTLLVFGGSLAMAAEQTILGSAFLVKNPSTPDRRKVVAKAKEPGSPNTLVGDPTLSGGVLMVTASGTVPTSQTFALPQGVSVLGKPFWSGDAVKGFKYKDPKGQNGAVKTLKIKRSSGGTFTIKATATGKIGTVLVTPPNPGTSACVKLSLTGGDTYAIEFGPTSRITNKGATLFKAKKPTAEGNCGAPTTTTVVTTTTTSSTSTTLYGSPSRAFVDRIMGLLD